MLNNLFNIAYLHFPDFQKEIFVNCGLNLLSSTTHCLRRPLVQIFVVYIHFDSDLDYEVSCTSISKTKMLKKNAVPSIFNPSKLNYQFNLF